MNESFSVSIPAVYTEYTLIIQSDSSWQLVKQSTPLTSVHPKCLHPYDRGWASDEHNILCIHPPAAWM